jgi:hypothetical protein
MLGRLGWPVSRCIDVYKEFARQVFDSAALIRTAKLFTCSRKYDGKNLESVIKNLVGEDVKMVDSDLNGGHCRV